jgi:two-component system, NtrC family, sensor kinase
MLNWFRNLNLKSKITLLLSLTAVFFIVLLSTSSYFFARQKLLNTIVTNQTSLVTSLSGQLDDKLETSTNYLLNLTKHLQKHSETDANFQTMLNHHDESSLFFDAGMLIISPHGKIIAENPYNKARIGLDRSHRDYFLQAIKTDNAVISSPYNISLPGNQPVVAISISIKNEHGQLIGVLVGRSSLNKGFLHELVSAKIGKTGYFYLINQQRTLLVHPVHSRMLTTVDAGKNSVVDDALKGWQGTRENINSKGNAGLTTIYKLKKAPWYLAAHYPLEEAYAPLNQVNLAFALLLLISIAFIVVAVRVCAQPLVRPLKQLSDHMLHLGEKKGEERFLPVMGNDEIDHLTQVFNELLQELDDEAAAREEAALTQKIVSEYMNEIAIWRAPDDSILFISANCHELTSYQDIEFYEEPQLIERIIHPDDIGIWSARHSEQGDDDSHPPFEIRLICKDGSIRWMRHVCHKTYDQHAVFTGRRGSFTDVTSLLEMQQNLLDEKLFIENMINSASTPLFVISSRHQVLYWNRALELMTCCMQAAIKGTDLHWSVFYPEKRATLADLVVTGYKQSMQELYHAYTPSKYIAGGFQAEGWYELNGSRRYIVFAAAPIRNSAGEVIAAIETLEDLTERQVMEESVRCLGQQLEQQHSELQVAFSKIEHAKQEWEDTLDHLHDFIIMTDTNHCIRRYNRILADMTGLPFNQLTGKDWRTLLQEVGFKFLNFNTSTGELIHLRSARNYDINVYPIKDKHDVLTGYVISLNDTTELRATTQELETTLDELNSAQSQIYQQEKMASIGQLAAGVAHEINNPMGFITSNLGSLDKYVGRLSEFIGVVDQAMQGCCDEAQAGPVLEARKRLKIDRILDDAHQLIIESQDGAGRVRRIVQDLKSFSRVDQAETALIDLNEALETTINIAWNEIKYVATMNREFGDIPKVKCFPQQLNQVFLNLLVNAAHALGDTRGEITVRTEQEGDQVLVKISDTGCGMPEEVQRKIFDPFFTTKEVGKGTGLGLSISYDIIKKHGGSIEVESEVGRGTTFAVRLPVDVEQAGGQA